LCEHLPTELEAEAEAWRGPQPISWANYGAASGAALALAVDTSCTNYRMGERWHSRSQSILRARTTGRARGGTRGRSAQVMLATAGALA
jgi:hypothetical protein